jgi:hypothetical protein
MSDELSASFLERARREAAPEASSAAEGGGARRSAQREDAGRLAIVDDASSTPGGDAGGRVAEVPAGDASRVDAPAATCRWCGGALPPAWRGLYCSKRCRQSAFRLRRRGARVSLQLANPRPMRFAYADPPYPGLAKEYYGKEPTYAGEVDHEALARRLNAEFPDGWALSTSAEALPYVVDCIRAAEGLAAPSSEPERFVLMRELHARGYRFAAWVKPGGIPPATYGIHSRWEVVVVARGRRRRPGVQDWLMAHAARGGGSLPGRKPIAFCAWLFDLLGMMPGDEFVDLFPGTGIVGRAWQEIAARAPPAEPGRRVVLASLLQSDDGREGGASASLLDLERRVVEDVGATPGIEGEASLIPRGTGDAGSSLGHPERRVAEDILATPAASVKVTGKEST